MKKLTKTTVKSFLKKNADNLFINVTSCFDGMTDGIESCRGGFKAAEHVEERFINDRNLGFRGISFTGSTRNWIEAYEDAEFQGYRIDNCCGCFIVAIRKAA